MSCIYIYIYIYMCPDPLLISWKYELHIYIYIYICIYIYIYILNHIFAAILAQALSEHVCALTYDEWLQVLWSSLGWGREAQTASRIGLYPV
jgi:hypothetical protein